MAEGRLAKAEPDPGGTFHQITNYQLQITKYKLQIAKAEPDLSGTFPNLTTVVVVTISNITIRMI